MNLDDYTTREAFTAQEMEHILQLPMIDVVELLARLPRAGPGRYQGEPCRALVKRLARGRLFADLIARQAANAEPEIRRGPDTGDPDRFVLLNSSTGEEFTVRFSGDLRDYLERQRQPIEAQTDPGDAAAAPEHGA
jgi:hypothetical protein